MVDKMFQPLEENVIVHPAIFLKYKSIFEITKKTGVLSSW